MAQTPFVIRKHCDAPTCVNGTMRHERYCADHVDLESPADRFAAALLDEQEHESLSLVKRLWSEQMYKNLHQSSLLTRLISKAKR